MAKVLMNRTVYDGKIYHRAGEKVNISGQILARYLSKNWASLIEEEAEKVEIKEIEIPQAAEIIETKEKKFKSKKNK